MKRLTIAALCATIILSFNAQAATKQTPAEKAVRSTVSSYLKAVKAYDIAKIRKCFANPSNVKLFDKKKYTAKFIRSMNSKNFTYKIKSVSTKKYSAKAKVDIWYLSCYEPFKYAFDDMVMYMYYHPKATDNQSDQYQYKRTVKYYKNFVKGFKGDYTINMAISIPLKNINGKWKISKITYEMKDAMHCDYHSAFDDYFYE